VSLVGPNTEFENVPFWPLVSHIRLWGGSESSGMQVCAREDLHHRVFFSRFKSSAGSNGGMVLFGGWVVTTIGTWRFG